MLIAAPVASPAVGGDQVVWRRSSGYNGAQLIASHFVRSPLVGRAVRGCAPIRAPGDQDEHPGEDEARGGEKQGSAGDGAEDGTHTAETDGDQQDGASAADDGEGEARQYPSGAGRG